MPNLRVFASAFAICLACAGAAVAQAPANVISMPVDEVRVVTFPAAVKTVYVGNPTIADVTIIDSRHVFLQAKSFGSTNVLALDNRGRQIVEERVTVFNNQNAIVTLQRGPARTTLNCAGERCEVQPTAGDEAQPFDTVTGQTEKHEQSLKSAAVAQQ
jgi:Pilus formation protein N terminal region